MEKKAIKEMLKRIIAGNTDIPNSAKEDLKIIIELGDEPEQILQACLLYLLNYNK